MDIHILNIIFDIIAMNKNVFYFFISAMLLLFKFVEYVPLKILECLSSSSSFLFTLLFFSKRNQLVKRNIKLVFPYYSNKEVIWLMYKFFRTQNDYIYQLIKQKRFSDDEMIRRCKFVNLDVIKNLH